MRALIIVAAAVMVLSIGSPVVANEMNLTTPSNAAAAAASAAVPAATTTAVNSPAAGGSPHPGTLDNYETVPGGAATEDPAIAYDTTSDEITQNTFETLVAYNGTSTATFVPVLATCVPGQVSYVVEQGLVNQCNKDYGTGTYTNFTGIYTSTGAAFTGSNGNPQYWTFVIDPAAHFYDPTTKKNWKVYPTDVMQAVGRTLAYADYSEAPGWILAQALLPIGNPGWENPTLDEVVHYPYNNTPQNIYDSMLINDTHYCPSTAMNGVLGNGCITFVANGSGSYWTNFLQFVEDVSGAAVTSSGFYQASGAALPGWGASHAAHGDGPTKLPDGGTTTDSPTWTNYVNGLSLTYWDDYEAASFGAAYPYVPNAQVQWHVVGSGPYYAVIDPYVSYALGPNPAYQQPSGCGGDSSSFAQISGTPYCDPAPGHFIENVSVIWETTAEGDSLGLNAITAGTADFAGFETSDIGIMEGDTNSSLWSWFLAPSLSSFFVPLNLLVDEDNYNTSLGATEPYGNGGQSLPENAMSDLGMRNFLTHSFPYTTWEDTINYASGIETGFLAGGPIPDGMGDYYPTNVSWPYLSGDASGNAAIVGTAGWWWNQLYNDSGGNYYDSEIANTCSSGNPCWFPMPYFDGDLTMQSDVTDWAAAIDAITGGAVQMFTYGLAFANEVPSIIGEFSSSALVGAIGTGWSPDYPSPSDYMAPEVGPNGDYSGPNSVSEQLDLPQYNLPSCPDNIANAGGNLAVETADLDYWANISQNPSIATGEMNSGCQGVAYNVENTWQAIAASETGAQSILSYDLIEQILNGLSLLIYNEQANALFTQAPWISEASINTNPVVGAGGIPVYYEVKYATVTPTAKVDVTEKGLPVGTTWHFSLNANGAEAPLYRTTVENTTALGTSSTGTIAYSLPSTTNVTLNAKQFYVNGYPSDENNYGGFDNASLAGYSVVSVTGSGVNYPYANVTSGSTLKITVLFGANTTVTFNAGQTKTGYSGLPTNTWSVTLTPTTKGTPFQATTLDDTTGGVGGISGDISFNLPAGLAYKYTIASPTFYKSSPSTGGGSVRTASSTDVYFALVTGNIVFVESGLGRTPSWSVTVTCVTTCGSTGGTFPSTSPVLIEHLATGTYSVAFSSETDFSLYATTEINVTAPHGQSVLAHYDQGRVTFTEVGLTAAARALGWSVTATCSDEEVCGDTTFTAPSTSSSATMELEDGTYTVSYSSESDYSLYEQTEVNVTLTHGASVRADYDQARVTFVEIGLTPEVRSAGWGMTITAGPAMTGTYPTDTSSGDVYLEDGTYTVSFTSETGYSLYATTEINVSATTAQTVDVHYDQGRVTFSESGLSPAGRAAGWGIDITSGPEDVGTIPVTATSDVLYLEDGTYDLTFEAPAGFTVSSAPPSVTVSATGAESVVVHFVAT